jgi:hypothetical protein
LRVLLLGAGGALAGIWLAPRFGHDGPDMIMPATIGLLVALGIGMLLFNPRS